MVNTDDLMIVVFFIVMVGCWLRGLSMKLRVGLKVADILL